MELEKNSFINFISNHFFEFAGIYLATGSLLFPIILHIIIDMRSFFLFTKKLQEETNNSLHNNI
ncbi:hypothetical protein GCM10020331_004410 [Ectobacillus funiculus]